MGAGKWVNGERPKPPFDTSAIEHDLDVLAAELRISGRPWSEVSAIFHRLGSVCLAIANQADSTLNEAALASIRQTVRRALAGTTEEPRERHRPVG